jgi:hypothetical protein
MWPHARLQLVVPYRAACFAEEIHAGQERAPARQPIAVAAVTADGEDARAGPPARSEAIRDAELVAKALDILELLASSSQGFPAREVSRHLGVDLDVAQEILCTLANRGFVDLDPCSKHYVVGSKLIELGGAGALRVRRGV